MSKEAAATIAPFFFELCVSQNKEDGSNIHVGFEHLILQGTQIPIHDS